MVEGKVKESFGPTLGDWRDKASAGKEKRLSFLVRTLGLGEVPQEGIRYQLLHRAASALITGEPYRAGAAVLLIHSFSQERTGWSDYQAFTRLFGVEAEIGTVQRLGSNTSIPLFGAWVAGNPAFLTA
jgi:hypothetical protein